MRQLIASGVLYRAMKQTDAVVYNRDSRIKGLWLVLRRWPWLDWLTVRGYRSPISFHLPCEFNSRYKRGDEVIRILAYI